MAARYLWYSGVPGLGPTLGELKAGAPGLGLGSDEGVEALRSGGGGTEPGLTRGSEVGRPETRGSGAEGRPKGVKEGVLGGSLAPTGGGTQRALGAVSGSPSSDMSE